MPKKQHKTEGASRSASATPAGDASQPRKSFSAGLQQASPRSSSSQLEAQAQGRPTPLTGVEDAAEANPREVAPRAAAVQPVDGLSVEQQVQHVMGMVTEGAKAKDLRKMVKGLTKPNQNPSFVKALANDAEGLELVSRVVASPGSGGQVFIKTALEQRYEVKIEDAWPEKTLRHVWSTARKVPVSHVKDTIDVLKRTWGPESSFSGGTTNRTVTMTKLIPLGLSMRHGENLLRGVGQKFLMKRSKYSKKMRKKSAFDMTVLHEVGHGVDHKLGVMEKYGKRKDFGGWGEYRGSQATVKAMFASLGKQPDIKLPASVDKNKAAIDDLGPKPEGKSREAIAARNEWRTTNATLAEKVRSAEKKAEDDAWQSQLSVPRAMLETVMEELIDGAKIGAAIDAASLRERTLLGLSPAAKKTLTATLSAHPLVKMCLEGRGTNKWNSTRSALAPNANHFKGRTFHKAYPDRWASYLVSAKNEGLSHYQWRAPGEWFAELYAHYFMDTLEGHPLYEWFENNIANNKTLIPEDLRAPDEEQDGDQQAGGQQEGGV